MLKTIHEKLINAIGSNSVRRCTLCPFICGTHSNSIPAGSARAGRVKE